MQRVFLVGTFDSQIALAKYVVLVACDPTWQPVPFDVKTWEFSQRQIHCWHWTKRTYHRPETRVFSLPWRMQTYTEHVVTRLLLDASKMALVWWKCTRIRGSLSWTCCIRFAQDFVASIKQSTTCASRVTASKVNERSWTCDSSKLSLSHTPVFFYLWKEQPPLLAVVQSKTTKCARIWIALQTNRKGLHMRIQNAVKGPTHA